MIFYMSENTSHVAPAVVGSLASIGMGMWQGLANVFSPALAQVSSPADQIPVYGAIVVGVMGIGWSIYSAGPDRAKKTLIEEIGTLQDRLKSRDLTVREQDEAIYAMRAERVKFQTEIGRLEGLLAKYQAQALDARPPAAPA